VIREKTPVGHMRQWATEWGITQDISRNILLVSFQKRRVVNTSR
jgi:hypothetical protein